MARPEIRPPIFIALQNAIAALLFAILLGAEIVRRLLYAYPQSDLLWQLSLSVSRTVVPVLHQAEAYLSSPPQLLAALAAGVIIPLLAWWTRYWFATAVAGHVALAIVIIMLETMALRGSDAATLLGTGEVASLLRLGSTSVSLLGLALLLLVMCVADHVAFLRFLLSFRRPRKR